MILKIEKLLPQQPKPMVVHISVEIPIFQHPWLVLSHPKNDASVISTNRSNNLVAKPRNIEIHETTQPVTKKKLPRCHHPSVMDFPPSLQITAFTTSPSRSLWLLIQLGLKKTPISASGTSGFSTLRRSSWGDGPNAVWKNAVGKCGKCGKCWIYDFRTNS